jgi:hypothetical protein
MNKSTIQRSENIKTILWFIATIELIILLLAIIFGPICGYKNSLIAHGILGAIIGLSMIAPLFFIVALDFVFKTIKKSGWIHNIKMIVIKFIRHLKK